MSALSNLERRGAVYYWRRRPPGEIACRIGKSHLKISLRTSDSRTARFRAAQLSALAERLFAMPMPAILTTAQARDFFTAAFSQHLSKLVQLKEIDRADGRPLDDIADIERARGHAYRMLAQFGADGGRNPSQKEREMLLDQGLTEAETERSLIALGEVRTIAVSASSIGKIERLLAHVGAEVNARNITASKNVYYRALGEALIQNAGRVVDDLPYTDLVERAMAAFDGAGAAEPASHTTNGLPTVPVATSREVALAEPVVSAAPELTIVELGDLLSENKQDGDELWTRKTASQAKSIFDLLQRFVAEKHGSNVVTSLTQPILFGFDRFLRGLPKNYGKSARDKKRSIVDIENRAAELAPHERGLATGTRNRHWTFIGQLITFAKSSGLTPDRDLDVRAFHARQTALARDQRPVPELDAAKRIFQTLIYTGYEDWEKMALPGDLVYHRAAYWVPMIVHYSAMRREEACGLAVDDIRDAEGTFYYHVRPNPFRRLKNGQSKRAIAVHPELLRLGFLDYVNAMAGLGHRRLFPDLYSPGTKSLLGDRFYREVAPVLQQGGVSSHAYRHLFDDQLKQEDVREELRSDLMGHAGSNETTNRYCDPIRVSKQLLLLEKLPVLTGHLQPAPVEVLPWVEKHEIAPWSKAAKRARRNK